MSNEDTTQNDKKKGFFSLFKREKKTNSEGSCCNMKIVPKEQSVKISSKGSCCNMRIVPKEKVTEDKDTSS